jgi:hypothetical protein
MGRESSTHGTDEKCMKVSIGIAEGRDHSEDLRVVGRIISEWISEK